MYVVFPGLGKKWRVRRFLVGLNDSCFELRKTDVNQERKTALENPKYAAIVERLRQIRPFLEGENNKVSKLSPETPIAISADWFEEQGDCETAEKIRAAFRAK